MGTFITKLDKDKKDMLEKIGSPRVPKKLTDSQVSHSSLDYDDIEEESNESVRVR